MERICSPFKENTPLIDSLKDSFSQNTSHVCSKRKTWYKDFRQKLEKNMLPLGSIDYAFE